MNSLHHKSLLLIVLLGFASFSSYAQLSGQNIGEFQYGQVPGDTAKFASIYDRLVLDYDHKALKVGVTLEQYWTEYADRNYIKPNQVRIQYKTDNWDIKLGNFYETLGRGTLMRTYQVPGAVLEDLSYRSRNFFHRDFLGAFVKYQGEAWSVKALAGQPLNNVYPPTQDYELRRPDSLAVLGGDYQIKSHKIEYNAMYLNNEFVDKWYSMMNAGGNILPFLSYYTELTIDNEGSAFGDEEEFGWYANLNFEFEKLSITTEFKDYNNFVIGEAVNEPPALIKQHTYRVLNRSTHVPIPTNETGWQIEALYYFEDGSTLTFNHARALNDFGKEFIFQEYFLEYGKMFGNKYDVKVFVDYANDDIKGEEKRTSLGFDVDYLMKKRRSINVEFEYQTFERFETRASNVLTSLAFNQGSKFTASLLTEYSSDNAVTEDDKDYKVWMGGNLKYKPNYKNTFLFFGGTRRGGPACTSGVCYEILDFEGVELRYNRRI
ncbi:MAG: DUF6029 family protein [Reichenbachiella sp.]